jgi:hypothetical protein
MAAAARLVSSSRSMRQLSTLLLGGLIWATLAATAQGQEGTSLYEPFPEPSSIARAERFVDELRLPGRGGQALNISREQLEDGVVVAAKTGATRPAPPTSGGPSSRAAGGDGLAPSLGWPLGVVLLLLVAIAAARLPRLAARPA